MYYDKKVAKEICKGILKNAKESFPKREEIHYSWIKEGKQYVTDGFCIVRLDEPIRTKDMKPIPAYITPPRIEDIISDIARNTVLQMDDRALPSLQRLNNIIEGYGDGAVKFDLGPGLPFVSIYYLRDMLKLFPDAVWYVHADFYERMKYPVYVGSEHGVGIIFPIIDSNIKPWKRPEKEEC